MSLIYCGEAAEVVSKLPGAKVYLDITFMVNFIMDLVILLAAARLSGSIINYGRLTLAAALGAAYACASVLMPDSLAFSMPAKIGFSALMLLAAFYPSGWLLFKKQLIYFYAISLFAAGAVMAIPNLTGNINSGTGYAVYWLVGAALLVVLLGRAGGRYLAEKIVPGILTFKVEMRFDSHKCSGCGFLDTGNSLRDPLTNRPVLVAEYGLLKDCLPEDFQSAIEGGGSEDEVFDCLTRSRWAHRLRLIPFQSIGQKNGILLGIRADEVLVNTGKRCVAHYDLVVALYRDRLSADDSYRLLIPAAVMEK